MKIVDGMVIDPRMEKRFQEPYLQLSVDEPVMEIGEPTYYTPDSGDNWRVIPCGPFFAVEHDETPFGTITGTWTDVVDLGRFNVLGFRRHQLVPVTVDTPDDRLELQMPVPRARRLLTKYASAWRMYVDQEAALDGRLSWLYELREPRCFGRTEVPNFEKSACTRKPKETVLYKGTHLKLCDAHHASHQHYIERLRISQRTQRPTG